MDKVNREENTAGNSTYKKLAIQWLNETLCFASSLVLADSFVLRYRQLLVAAERVCLEPNLLQGLGAVQMMEDMGGYPYKERRGRAN